MIYLILSVLFITFLGFIGYRANQRARILKSREPVKFHPGFSSPFRNQNGATRTPSPKLPPVIARAEQIRMESRDNAKKSLDQQLPLLSKDTLEAYSQQLTARIKSQKALIDNKNLPLVC